MATTNNFKEYRLMYLWGAWVTSEKFSAESDNEAIYDADDSFNTNSALQSWPYEVALFCGNRQVKAYK